ncbi:hypothetical protein P7C73_g4184, partial [Tremellales sp. Uapishka_1]
MACKTSTSRLLASLPRPGPSALPLSTINPTPRSIHTPSTSTLRPSIHSLRHHIPRWQLSRTATTLATPSTSTPPLPLSKPTFKVIAPSLEKIKEEGFFEEDVKLIPEAEATLVITPEAVQQLATITSREPDSALATLALRVGVESGGCHGYQYTMDLTEERGVEDYVFQPVGARIIPVVVDLVSLGLLKGSTLHYATELIGSSFRLQDNPQVSLLLLLPERKAEKIVQAKAGGACGCGVSWEAK